MDLRVLSLAIVSFAIIVSFPWLISGSSFSQDEKTKAIQLMRTRKYDIFFITNLLN